jgi:hypothetical protein
MLASRDVENAGTGLREMDISQGLHLAAGVYSSGPRSRDALTTGTSAIVESGCPLCPAQPPARRPPLVPIVATVATVSTSFHV